MLKEYQIAAGAKAFSTTRKGGVSEGNYGEFNINEYCGDSLEHIAENRRLLAAELGIDPDRIILPHQVHGVEVRQIPSEYLTLPEDERKALLEGVDAVMTDVKGLCIGVSTADCIPVLLYDEEHHAVAAIHAGWRGTQKRIVSKTVQEMTSAFNTNPKGLKAIIGPGISLENFEVGGEVYEAFRQAAFPMEKIAEQRPSTAQPLKWHINLPLCNELILEHVGVQPENIFQADICTYVHCDEYFSARRLGIESGRIFTGIMLRYY